MRNRPDSICVIDSHYPSTAASIACVPFFTYVLYLYWGMVSHRTMSEFGGQSKLVYTLEQIQDGIQLGYA